MASTYLQRTFSTPTSRKIFTVSLWFKRSGLGSTQNLFGNGTGTNTDGFGLIDFLSDDRLRVTETPDYATGNYEIYTSRKFRDTSAWYHVVVAFDTTQATASDRIKIYTNGQLETSLDTASYPALNLDTKITLNNSHIIGRRVNSATDYFNGSMAHYHFIDGTAYDASAFGETDATTGIWKPKTAPSVTYGTNGFFLKFENSGSMGTDSSGNANNFTVNGNLTQTLDTPSNVFATGNPLYRGANNNLFSNGNLTFTGSGEAFPINIATFQPSAGKWYWETKPTTIVTATLIGMVWNGYTTGGTGRIIYYPNGTILFPDASSISTTTYTTGDIIGCALDLDSATTTLKFYKNGTLVYTYNDVTTGLQYSTRGEGMIFWQLYTNDVVSVNFGNGYFGTTPVASAQNPDDGIGIFEYTVPTGYKALCTKSINAQEYN